MYNFGCYRNKKIQWLINLQMFNSVGGTKSEKKQRVLNKAELQGLSPEEIEFAEEQFRLIYAQQMSKLTSEMSHLKRVQENLHELDEQESKNLKEQYDKLKKKMASIEEKRNKKIEDKKKQYKQNDQRWFHKLKQIQQRFKQQNRDAIEKAKKYREQSQNYWKDKERRLQQQQSKINLEHSRTSHTKRHEYTEMPVLNKSYMGDSQIKKKYHGIDGYKKRMTINQEVFNSNSYSNANLHNSTTDRDREKRKQQLDTQIQLHKEKSQHLQREKQHFMFQKAIEKMENIQKKRQKATKKKQAKIAEPTKPRHVDHYHASIKQRNNNKSKDRLKQHSLHSGKQQRSKQSLDKLIQDHLYAKQQKQQREFEHRGEILENNVQRNRKEKIMKMVKNKVHNLKVDVLKKQTSKHTIGIA